MKNNKMPKIVYAGDREISVKVLEFIIKHGVKPSMLFVCDQKKGSHPRKLLNLCKHLNNSHIARGEGFRRKEAMDLLRKIKPDFIICIHFPYVIPREILDIPKQGALNLHPAYLPYNRGWHTASWAIWNNTPYGATLHFMDENIDTGDIIHQRLIKVLPSDTADTIYKKTLNLEVKVFKEAWPLIVSKRCSRKKQPVYGHITYSKKDIISMQHVNLDERVRAGDLIKRLRALTTNNIKEAAYFKSNGKLYRMQIKISEEKQS